jgi:anti-sigma B factor antagonist
MDVIVETRTEGPWTVVVVAGELDLHTSPPLRDNLLGLIERGTSRIAVDMSKVDFMDSSSLGALITCLKRVREKDGRLALVGMDSSPMKVMTLTGLDRVFELVGSTDELPTT